MQGALQHPKVEYPNPNPNPNPNPSPNPNRATLAKQAGRGHKFEAPPRRMKKLPQWDWVTHHCKEDDGWLDKIRQVMLAQPSTTKC